MQLFLKITLIVPLLMIAVQAWKIEHMLKAIRNDDEPFGEERTKILGKRITWIGICSGMIVVLRIASSILRFIEIY